MLGAAVAVGLWKKHAGLPFVGAHALELVLGALQYSAKFIWSEEASGNGECPIDKGCDSTLVEGKRGGVSSSSTPRPSSHYDPDPS